MLFFSHCVREVDIFWRQRGSLILDWISLFSGTVIFLFPLYKCICLVFFFNFGLKLHICFPRGDDVQQHKKCQSKIICWPPCKFLCCSLCLFLCRWKQGNMRGFWLRLWCHSLCWPRVISEWTRPTESEDVVSIPEELLRMKKSWRRRWNWICLVSLLHLLYHEPARDLFSLSTDKAIKAISVSLQT